MTKLYYLPARWFTIEIPTILTHMNIFVFDTDIVKNAACHPDKLVVKMPLELCQMLSSVPGKPQLTKADGQPYGITHANHPCTLWLAESEANYQYAVNLCNALCYEYTLRYNKKHACQTSLELAGLCYKADAEPPANHPICIKSEYQQTMFKTELSRGSIEQAVQFYRAYLISYKAHYVCWTKSPIPDWWPTQDGYGRLACSIKPVYSLANPLEDSSELVEATVKFINATAKLPKIDVVDSARKQIKAKLGRKVPRAATIEKWISEVGEINLQLKIDEYVAHWQNRK